MLTPRAARALAWAGNLLRLCDRRLPTLERIIGASLTEAEAGAVAAACRVAGVGFGAYYSWRLRRLAIAATFAQLGREQALRLVARHDASDYAPLDAALADPRGMLLAIPHHGVFVPAIFALCERLRKRRDVFVLHAPTESRSGRGGFGGMHREAHGALGGAARVAMLADDRPGLARAIRELRAGNVLVIMPDAYRAIDATYQVPFCGAQRNVMLGTAAIARRADARVLPVVALPGRGLFGFACAFGPLLRPVGGDGSREGALHADYRLTLALFRAYEAFMDGDLQHWQYCTSHAADGAFATGLTPQETVDVVGPLLLDDPRLRLAADVPIRLDEGLPA